MAEHSLRGWCCAGAFQSPGGAREQVSLLVRRHRFSRFFPLRLRGALAVEAAVAAGQPAGRHGAAVPAPCDQIAQETRVIDRDFCRADAARWAASGQYRQDLDGSSDAGAIRNPLPLCVFEPASSCVMPSGSRRTVASAGRSPRLVPPGMNVAFARSAEPLLASVPPAPPLPRASPAPASVAPGRPPFRAGPSRDQSRYLIARSPGVTLRAVRSKPVAQQHGVCAGRDFVMDAECEAQTLLVLRRRAPRRGRNTRRGAVRPWRARGQKCPPLGDRSRFALSDSFLQKP